MKDVTNPVILPLFHSVYDVPFLPVCVQYLTFHTVGLTDSLHPSAQHFKTSEVFLIYFHNCPSLSTIQSCAPNVVVLSVSALNVSPIC